MKSVLKLISLFLAAGVPGALAVEFAGLSLPPAVDALHLFAAFVAAVTLLTVFADYQPAVGLAASRRSLRRLPRKAVYPLAA